MVDRRDPLDTRIDEVVKRTWGFDELRPLQRDAIRAGLDHRDSLTVLPTGGGKSLCYQVPPLVAGRTDVVVSPLISLMKDQVDGLRANDYPAAAIYSGQPAAEKAAACDALDAGRLRLLFVSPERLVAGGFQERIRRVGIRAFAIDEAHCISQWGHDFRPEYRRLAALREGFPEASLHAYTATATPRVRDDIAAQLELRDPRVLVGCFDRPNLTYRVQPRAAVAPQVLEILSRHAGEATIVYCITRAETESLAAALRAADIRAEAYHAGLAPGERTRIQDAFSSEELDVVTATVAFGMGIDRSNVRCVIHAAMPKSIEHYQQETGRAGRDGLEAECVLLHSGADVMRWEGLIRVSASSAADPDAVASGQLELLKHMQRFASSLLCRHRALSNYFGQAYEGDGCAACDVCLGEITGLDDATEIAQKILSCVYRLGQRFGIGYVADVLRGADTEAIRGRRHAELTTHGLLAHVPRSTVMSYVYQLVDQGLLDRTPGDRPVLTLNDRSIQVLRGERDVLLAEPRGARVRRSRADTESWEGVDRSLFDRLRDMRYRIAHERGVPAYVILTDATLRALARSRPRDVEALTGIHGIGEKKKADLGEAIIDVIRSRPIGRGSPSGGAPSRGCSR